MLIHTKVPQKHDEALRFAFEYKNKLSRHQVTDNFLASLSSNNLKYRSGLPALAIMQSFPEHCFVHHQREGPDYQCGVCCSDLEFHPWDNQQEYESIPDIIGGLASYGDIYRYAFFLLLQAELPPLTPNLEDLRIFNEIVSALGDLPPNAKPSDAQRAIRKISGFKSNEEQRHALLETFGYCGILETGTHKGFVQKYTKLGLAPRKSHSSDWCYPVDWWVGSDGVNKEAITYWFSDRFQARST